MSFGTIVYIPSNQRYAVIVKECLFNYKHYTEAYPLSSQLWACSDKDILCAVQDSTNEYIAEQWNSIYLSVSDYIVSDMVLEPTCKQLLNLFYINQIIYDNQYRKLYSLFTGPPITTSQDIRNVFKHTELIAFSEFKLKSNLKDLNNANVL